jgi:hypothetical protein
MPRRTLYYNVFWRNRDADVVGDIASMDGSPGADNKHPRRAQHHRHQPRRLPELLDIAKRRRDLEPVALAGGAGLPLTDPANSRCVRTRYDQAVRAGDSHCRWRCRRRRMTTTVRRGPTASGRYLYGAYGQ